MTTTRATIYRSLHEPPMESKTPGACWRCDGRGEVPAYDSTMTPCGACLGTKIPPEPCPKCGSVRVKILVNLDEYTVCWYCRTCTHQGPSFPDGQPDSDFKAMNAWNDEAKKGKKT